MNATGINISRLKEYPITDVLRALGYPHAISGLSGHDMMIFSPFHDDNTPSFHINFKRNVWYDFSIGTGGDNIDLVRRYKGCSWKEACEWLTSSFPEIINEVVSVPIKKEARHPKLVVEKVIDTIVDSSLLQYSEERGIDSCILNLYCNQLLIKNTSTGKTYWAIGFPNNSGGYVLRRHNFKAATSNDCTFIRRYSDSVMVFEGFFNFLSACQIECLKDKSESQDIVVLNSVVNMKKAVPFISEHCRAYLCLDNDDTGRKTTESIFDLCKSTQCVDYSSLYAQYNDLNDYLKDIIRQTENQTMRLGR